MQTELFRNEFFSNETGGVNQGNVSSKFVENIKIPFPTLPEQLEIVRILDDLFAKEQNAKDLCDLIVQIETIKKTILGKAFRGELGTNEAGEGSALNLLKKMIYS
jgi:Type I restriction modification DNA specificity domain.